MYLLVILFPLLSSIFAGLFGRFLGRKGAVLLSVSFSVLSFLLSCSIFYEVALSGSLCSIKGLEWFACEMFDSSWGFYFDSLSSVMLIVITCISSLVHIYSVSYMSEDAHLPRFMSYLSIFTFFMLMLVTSDNLLQMFFGWEGVGLASYLLINFWFTRLQANKSSIKAMLVNRVGDFGLAIGIMLIFQSLKTVSFPVIFVSLPYLANQNIIFFNLSFDALNVIALCLFIGAVGKSAQLGLHTWLPDAMEGPTPVSALIHAATMVTAGVFMIARCSLLFEYAQSALMVVAFVGGITCFFAATTGLVQNDLKRVIAYSTCSQLGYMIFACGLSNYSVGAFHLMNHAFFKALLFLGAGSVIHALGNEQDMRKMGGLVQLLPFTYAIMLIGSLTLAGFPFLTGFFSKDVILEVAWARYTINANLTYYLGSICVLFTSYYSFRLLFLTFFTQTRSEKQLVKKAHDAPTLMAGVLIFLAIASIFVGYLARDMMIGLGTSFWGHSIFTLPTNSNLIESEFIPQSVKMVPLFSSMLGILIAFIATEHRLARFKMYTLKKSILGIAFYSFLNKRWFVDRVYNDFLAHKALDFAYRTSFKRLDKGMYEILGPQGISIFFSKATQEISKLQSGLIYHYALVMLFGLTLFITSVTLSDFLDALVDTRLCFLFPIQFLIFNLLRIDFTEGALLESITSRISPTANVPSRV